MKLSIIVPCYNESDNITKLHDELLPVIRSLITTTSTSETEGFSSAEIIFVDDGSRDGTFKKLKEYFDSESDSHLDCKFLKHDVNRGLGAAIRTGFSSAVGDIIVTVDSDGTYKFSEIPSIISYLKPGVDLVTASPYHPQGDVLGVPADRLFLSKGSSFLYRCLVDWNIYTYTALFRAYRSDVIKNIDFKSDGFLAGTEILVNAVLRGYHALDFPAVLSKRMFGVSKAKIAQTIFAHLNFQFHLLLFRLQTFIFQKDKPIIRGNI